MTATPISSILLVLVGSFIGSIGMVFLKKASHHLHKGFLHIISVNAAVGVGLFLISSLFYLTGIRNGQLSVLYPMVSLSYVWVAILSVLIFHESMNAIKIAGIATIILGVAILGRGGRK